MKTALHFIAPLAALALLSGCARTTTVDALSTDYAPTDADSEIAFWHKLPERPTVTNDEGIHGLIIMAQGEDPSKSWDERLTLAREKSLVSGGFSEPANVSMSRGTLANGLVRTLKIKGGVLMSTIGGPRYATRELVYLNIFPADSTEFQSISGLEYVGVMSKAQDYQSVGRARPMR